MKRRLVSVALSAFVAGSAMLLAGCSTTDTRISSHPEIYQTLSAQDQALVTQGKVREGMSQNAVWLAWGAPDQKLTGRSHGQPAETWVYTSSTAVYDPYPRFGFGLGYGFYGSGGYYRHRGHFAYRSYGFYDPFYDPFFYSRFEHVSYAYKTVSFQGGRVVGYQFLAPPGGGGAPGY